MKTVKEIKEMYEHWLNHTSNTHHMAHVFDALIGITERIEAIDLDDERALEDIAFQERLCRAEARIAALEAMEQPPKVACDACEMVINPNQREDIRWVDRRGGMISALRWVNSAHPADHPVGCACRICLAITHLENGGVL